MPGSIQFRLGSIPVRIHFAFLLTAIIFSYPGRDLRSSAIWTAVVFVSVLAHELGHALAGIVFGLRPQIDIHGMGGTTSWLQTQTARVGELPPGKRIVISIAGPFVGFVLGIATIVATMVFKVPPEGLVHQLVTNLVWVNMVWGAFNLLPMIPLDGGHVMAAVFHAVTGGKGQLAALYVSVAVGVAAGGLALAFHQMFGVVLAALYVVQNVRTILAARRVHASASNAAGVGVVGSSESASREAPVDLQKDLSDGFGAIQRGDGRAAIALGENVVSRATSVEVRRQGISLLARGKLLEGHWASLMQLLEGGASVLGATELSRFEEAARELDRPDEAAKIREWVERIARMDGIHGVHTPS